MPHKTVPTGSLRRDRGIGARAISVPLATVTSGLSRPLADAPRRSSGHVKARIEQLPKLTVEVSQHSPANESTARSAGRRLLDRALRLIHRRLAVGGLAVAGRRPLDRGCRLPRLECGAVTEEADDH